MQSLEKQITVTKDDLDELNHVNNVRYVQWVNDIAIDHWQQAATPEIINDYFWVLVSHQINYKSSAVLGDEIILKTYILKNEGASATRIVEMYNKLTQKLIVKSETHWCLIQQKTNRPTRITEAIKNLFL